MAKDIVGAGTRAGARAPARRQRKRMAWWLMLRGERVRTGWRGWLGRVGLGWVGGRHWGEQ